LRLILSGSSDSHVSRSSKHAGAIKALQFNSFRHELLATAGAKEELYITDLNNVNNAFRLGTTAARADRDFDAVDWNKKVPHILATGSNGGFVIVWDVRAKKENLTLNNFGRKAVSAIAWDPDVPTRLATAIPNDQEPLVLLWDLRNSSAPERTLKGHEQGVLSLSWCLQDSNLLLSCGKDNRTVCWNPRVGESVGEFPIVTNWTFQTKWNPHNPSLLATASFDGKIGIQTIQSTNSKADQGGAAASQSLDGEDFFNQARTQPQGAAFSLAKAPKWLERPVSVSFGFGGKLVKVSSTEGKSTIKIDTFSVDDSIGDATKKFEDAIKSNNLSSVCNEKISGANTEEEKADWTILETLNSGSRKKLVQYLGFQDAESKEADEAAAQANGASDKADASFFGDDGGEDTFLSDLASTKGAKTNNPFHIFTGSETDTDQQITRALILGSFEKALDICLKENRLSDAFMIAICGGQKCIDKAQAAYFKKSAEGPKYLRLLASVVGKNLWDVVYNADLSNWKEVMATICTFANETEFPDLCEALGDRLEEAIDDKDASGTLRKDASFCYLAGSKLEKVVVNWVQELQETESASLDEAEEDNSFSVHAKSLQNFIEKVTVFRHVTKFQDPDRQKTSDWKLGSLYEKYIEYADIVAAHGQLQIAERYLDLVPEKYPAAEVSRNRVKQATRKAAPQVPAKQAAAQSNAFGARTQRVVPTFQSTAPSPAPAVTPSPYAPIGAPVSAQPTASPYAPPGGSTYTPQGYQPPQQGGYVPPGANIPTPQPYGSGFQPSYPGIAPPPRTGTASPKLPAAATKNMTNWNDLPTDFSNKPTPRRGTPSQYTPAVSSPFANSPVGVGPPGPPGPPPRTSSPFTAPTQQPLAPPPKGPPRISSPSIGSPISAGSERPSSAANAYAPPLQSSQFAPPQPTIPRGPSPYQPPPSAAPPSNRYAPAPGSIPSQPANQPPPRQIAPNPYAPQPGPYAQPNASPYANLPPPGPGAGGPPQAQPSYISPPPQQATPSAPPRGPPPQGPPRAAAGGPPTGPPRASAATPQPEPDSRPGTAEASKPPPAKKYRK